MRITILLLAMLMLGGCATDQVWVRPGATSAQFNQDLAECKYDAAKAAAPSMATSGFLNGVQNVTLTKQCLEARGYSQHTRAEASAMIQAAHATQ